jgi:hypothetical protein
MPLASSPKLTLDPLPDLVSPAGISRGLDELSVSRVIGHLLHLVPF